MNAAEKFNSTTESIEALVKNGLSTKSEIGEIVASKNGRSVRDMSTIFQYLADMSLGEYIGERKMNAAYYALVQDRINKVQAAGIAGYSDQQGFTKAFKKQYGMTPGAAQKAGDLSLLTDALKWDHLAQASTSENTTGKEDTAVENLVFGVSDVSFAKIEKVLELESFYGFKRMFSKYAFELSEKAGYSLESCFRYAESLHEFGGDFDDEEEDDMTPEENLREWGERKEYQVLFFERGISVDMSFTLLEDCYAKYEEIISCDPKAIKYFPGFETGVSISFSYYIDAYKYYSEFFDVEETEEYFEEYLDYVTAGSPFEIAMEAVFPFAADEEDIDRGDDLDLDLDAEWAEIERYSTLDALADEEERWHGVRLDEDIYYDPENVAYDTYDREDENMW